MIPHPCEGSRQKTFQLYPSELDESRVLVASLASQVALSIAGFEVFLVLIGYESAVGRDRNGVQKCVPTAQEAGHFFQQTTGGEPMGQYEAASCRCRHDLPTHDR